MLTVTFILTLSLTNFSFKIEHANISKGKASNFIAVGLKHRSQGIVFPILEQP